MRKHILSGILFGLLFGRMTACIAIHGKIRDSTETSYSVPCCMKSLLSAKNIVATRISSTNFHFSLINSSSSNTSNTLLTTTATAACPIVKRLWHLICFCKITEERWTVFRIAPKGGETHGRIIPQHLVSSLL